MATKAAEQIHPYSQEHEDEHGLDPIDGAVGALGAADGSDDAEVVLALASLMQDERGEIVLYNDSNLRRMAIATDVATVGEGVSGRHLTKSGENVSGFRYVAFANGVKLYYQDALRLEIRPDGA